MAKPNPWPTIEAERRALADDLAGLGDEQWDTPSLCGGWTARDVLAHMTATAKIGTGGFFGKLIGNGFSFEKVQAKGIADERGASPADTLARFRGIAASTTHPPGPVDTWLGEAIIHSEDIRRPLGITHTYPMDAVARVADFLKGSNLIIGTKKRIAGLHLVATDTEWSHGEGPEVRGPMLPMLLAMAGRKPAIDDLEGDGVATLRSRD